MNKLKVVHPKIRKEMSYSYVSLMNLHHQIIIKQKKAEEKTVNGLGCQSDKFKKMRRQTGGHITWEQRNQEELYEERILYQVLVAKWVWDEKKMQYR